VPAFDAVLAYLATGAVAGFFAGLLGVGGGVIVVPILALLFAGQGFPAREVFHLALGTSMATILFTSVSSLRAHHAHGAVLWPVVGGMVPAILAGTFLGAQVAVLVTSRQLSIFFAGFMLFVAFQMVANRQPRPSRTLPGRGGLSLAGLIIGTIASLAAMGGGALTVPYLIRHNVRPHQAIGTSSAVGLPIAFGGTLVQDLKLELPAAAFHQVRDDGTLAWVRGNNRTDGTPLAQLPPLESRLASSVTRGVVSGHLVVDGVDHWFCNPGCRDAFAATLTP